MNSVAIPSKLATVELKPRIGTEIRADVDTLLSGRHRDEIREILEQRGVVIFRRLDLTREQQLAFAHTVGEVLPQGEKGLFPISLDKSVNGPAADYLKGSLYWHIDGATDDVPTRAAILNARVLAPSGGQTEFCNTYAAWDDLPAAEKAQLEKLRVVHSFEWSQRHWNPTPTCAELKHWQSYAKKVHPLVWTHRSGRKSLVLGCTASHIEGMDIDEGRLLLCRLQEWATRPEYVYTHEWELGDLLMWDNTGTMHRALPYDPDCGRLMTRVTIEGEEPLV
jgi:alpha-ketoglutarate-dependent taurine dioxygenase